MPLLFWSTNATHKILSESGAQVTVDAQPKLLMVPLLLNLKVKQPLGSLDVNGPGMVVPQYPPVKPPGTFAPVLELAICGEAIESPSKTYRASAFASVLKAEKVTVTTSPGIDGHIVTDESALGE